MDIKSRKEPGLIKRNEDNSLDKNDADKVIKKVTEDLICTQRDFQKENEFRHARSGKRDVIVKIVIYQRNSVNGRVVKSDNENPLFERLSEDSLDQYRFKYFEHIDFEIMAHEMPMDMAKIGKAMIGCFKALTNYLARMGVFNNV